MSSRALGPWGSLARHVSWLAACCVVLACSPRSPSATPLWHDSMQSDEPTRLTVPVTDQPSPYFVKDGEPFCFVGANNYYLSYKPRAAVLDVLDTAREMNAQVLRMWAFLDRGALDGSVPDIRPPGHKDGVYFQYWDPVQKRPAYNDGVNGLERLDFVLHEARQRGLRLILVLTNNWRDFGGMDQYLVWYGRQEHHAFFFDPSVKQAYKDWVEHVVTRTNSIDGVPYAEDPAIFAWELANEPRLINYEDFDRPGDFSTDTITHWADEMSTFIQSLDGNHMISVGDEGFLPSDGAHFAYRAAFGVDSERLTGLSHIDFGTYHLYPEHWAADHHFGNAWIQAHIAASRRWGKPLVLGEYGMTVRREAPSEGRIVAGWRRREAAYHNWNSLILAGGGQAALFWLLAGQEGPKRRYPDYDQFSVYRGDATYELLLEYAQRMPREAAACRMARGTDHGAKSPFVRAWRPAERPREAPAGGLLHFSLQSRWALPLH